MAQQCPAWGTFVPFKKQLYRKGNDITNYWCYFRREAGGSDLINHIPVSLATALIQGADLFLGDFKNVLLC